ncbi:hypothetical protein AAEX63_11600 [Luteococcus sp. H138]|uniref:hypothetical protein n=1 Tax=unclassified Luteococcus TaxID=2639923 RepID=UPI00313B5721
MNAKQPTDKQWLDEMIIELRLRNVRGPAIGDAVAAVETHCAEAGESAAEAFGAPREFARALDFPGDQLNHTTPTKWARLMSPIAIGLVGLYLVPGIVLALFTDAPVAVRWGEIVTLGLLALFVLLAARVPGVLRAITQRWINAALILGGGITVLTMSQVLLDVTAFHVPLWLAVVACLATLAYSVIGMRHTIETEQDLIIDPRTRRPMNPAIAAAASWIFVISAVGLALITAIPLWFAS